MPVSRRAVRRFVVTYLVALLAFLAAGGLLIGGRRVLAELQSMGPRPRPTAAIQQPYSLRYRQDDGPWVTLEVDRMGDACEPLRASELLYSACVLATGIDTEFIASDAHGELNTKDTFAMVAISWRARLDRNPADCHRSGLLGTRLEQCLADVADPDYIVTDHGLSVQIGE